MIAFIRRFIVSAERHDDVPPLSASQHLALDTLQGIASDPCVHLAMDFRPGDIQLINNCAILHSREGYTDDLHPNRRRHLLRLWLTAANGWPLPDAFYEGYPGRTAAGRPDGIRTKGTVLKVSLDPRAAWGSVGGGRENEGQPFFLAVIIDVQCQALTPYFFRVLAEAGPLPYSYDEYGFQYYTSPGQ